MTTVLFDSVDYAKAVRAAGRHGLALNAVLADVVSEYAAEDDLYSDDYANPDVLPGESVYKTPEETRAHFMGLLNEVRKGV